MDVFMELWTAAKQAGPFAALILLVACWSLNERNKAQDARCEEEKKALRVDYEKRLGICDAKYDAIIGRFIQLAGDTNSTLKDWRDVLVKAGDK